MARQARVRKEGPPPLSKYGAKVARWRREELRANSAPPAPRAPAADPGKTGAVKWFNAEKGYGFIVPDAGGPDLFVHVTAVERAGLASLGEGDRVRYETIPARQAGKFEAIDLRLIG